MDDDIDFETSPKTKQSARRGRRAQKADNFNDSSFTETNESLGQPPPNQDVGERPTRRVGGWGEEEDSDLTSGSKSKSARRRGDTHEETVNTNFTNFDDDGSDDNDIPVIPDLEDSVEDTSNQIAIAPSVA